MNPDSRMALSLLLSLVVSAGNLRLAAAGDADILDVGVRYVVAFVIAFVAVGAIGRVFNEYLEAVDARRAEQGDEEEPTEMEALRLAEE